jgi:hypothetical protein
MWKWCVEKFGDWLFRFFRGGRGVVMLPLLYLTGCSTLCTSPYQPDMPVFQVPPIEGDCTIVLADGKEMKDRCLKMLKADFVKTLRELRATCLSLGRSETECQIVDQRWIVERPQPERYPLSPMRSGPGDGI